MIKINGREYGLFYSVGAHCKFDDYIVAHQDLSYTRGVIQKAIIMSEAYAQLHGGDILKSSDILGLPNKVFAELKAAVEKQERIDSGLEIEVEASEKNPTGGDR